MCQVNVDNYFRKINELHSKPSADGKLPNCDDQWTHKPWLIQKDLLKTLDTQWTEHVQATSYSRKMEQQRLSQCGNNAERAAEMNADQLKNQLAVDQAYIEKSAASNKLNQQVSDGSSSTYPSSGSSINEKIDHLTLQNLSKSQCFNSPAAAKKLYPTMWKDKTLSKVDELISIKMYNQIVMQNLNRNKSLCSSASSTSSCSSGSSYAKTINSLTNSYLSSNQHPANHASAVSNPVMPTDLDSATIYPSSSGSSCCSVNSAASSSTQSSALRTASKEQDKSSIMLPKYSHYSNSPLKKRKKFISQYAFDSPSSLTDKMDDSLWRPW